MKPYIEKVDLSTQRSLIVRHQTIPYFDAPYHFHPEYELTYILRGYGQRFVGNTVERFEARDFVLLGPDLPHFWRSDDDFYRATAGQMCESIVIQFSPQLAEHWLATVPEFSSLQNLLAQANRGIVFGQDSRATPIESFLHPMVHASPVEQMLLFLQLLHELTSWLPVRRLTEAFPVFHNSDTEALRMARILDYTILHFRETISLADVAEAAHLSEAAFCRYFRQRTHKTYFTYLNELRLNHARQLLITTDLSVSQVALEAGFQNLSYFHRLFRKHIQHSPLRFRRMYRA